MTTIRSFTERVAWSNVDSLIGEVRRLRREKHNLTEALSELRASTVASPPASVLALLHEAEWMGTLDDDAIVWLRDVRAVIKVE